MKRLAAFFRGIAESLDPKPMPILPQFDKLEGNTLIVEFDATQMSRLRKSERQATIQRQIEHQLLASNVDCTVIVVVSDKHLVTVANLPKK